MTIRKFSRDELESEPHGVTFKDVYPWGSEWPPPSISGNFADASFKAAGGWEIPGYSDGYATTSPVGSFLANRQGLYDLAGNVWEWCDDWFDHEEKARVLRGGSWYFGVPGLLLSSCRNYFAPDNRNNNIGFRVVLVVASARKVFQRNWRVAARGNALRRRSQEDHLTLSPAPHTGKRSGAGRGR